MSNHIHVNFPRQRHRRRNFESVSGHTAFRKSARLAVALTDVAVFVAVRLRRRRDRAMKDDEGAVQRRSDRRKNAARSKSGKDLGEAGFAGAVEDGAGGRSRASRRPDPHPLDVDAHLALGDQVLQRGVGE